MHSEYANTLATNHLSCARALLAFPKRSRSKSVRNVRICGFCQSTSVKHGQSRNLSGTLPLPEIRVSEHDQHVKQRLWF
eukprot:4216258-Amphidinium_carterae.1